MVQRQMERLEVSPWMGEQAVHSLPIIPAAYFPIELAATDKERNAARQQDEKTADDQAHGGAGGGATMLQRHLELGKLYCSLMESPNYLEYDGQLVNGVNMQFQGPTGFVSCFSCCVCFSVSFFLPRVFLSRGPLLLASLAGGPSI
jgi:hypothetical protein